MDRVDYQSLIVQDLINDHAEEKLNLNPWYQRRSVWTRPQKSYLINTLFERKPIPALYVRHSIDLEKGKSIKEVVDGQQRARAIIEYCNNGFQAKINTNSARKDFSALSPSDREKLLLTPIPIGFLLGASDQDVIDIFARINSVAKTLNPQEKRNAKFSGEFKQFCVAESTSRVDFWRNYGIFSANDIARMNEVQFISDIVLNFIQGLSDFTPRKLDKIYQDNEEEFNESSEISDRLNKIFEIIYRLDSKSITDTIFKRQPVFWSLLVALDEKQHINVTNIQNAIFQIDAVFHDDSVDDQATRDFRNAVTQTTQRIAARKIRHDFLMSKF